MTIAKWTVAKEKAKAVTDESSSCDKTTEAGCCPLGSSGGGGGFGSEGEDSRSSCISSVSTSSSFSSLNTNAAAAAGALLFGGGVSDTVAGSGRHDCNRDGHDDDNTSLLLLFQAKNQAAAGKKNKDEEETEHLNLHLRDVVVQQMTNQLNSKSSLIQFLFLSLSAPLRMALIISFSLLFFVRFRQPFQINNNRILQQLGQWWSILLCSRSCCSFIISFFFVGCSGGTWTSSSDGCPPRPSVEGVSC